MFHLKTPAMINKRPEENLEERSGRPDNVPVPQDLESDGKQDLEDIAQVSKVTGNHQVPVTPFG